MGLGFIANKNIGIIFSLALKKKCFIIITIKKEKKKSRIFCKIYLFYKCLYKQNLEQQCVI